MSSKLPVFNLSNKLERKINDALVLLFGGKMNITGTCTLDSGGSATTTTITDPRCGQDSVPIITPTTAAAAGDHVHVSAVNDGSFVITHSAAGTIRSYRYVLLG